MPVRSNQATLRFVRHVAGQLGLLFLFLHALVACADPEPPAGTQNNPLAVEGQRVFKQNCARCHSVNPDTVIVGPSLAGVATRAETRVEGLSGREYIHTSIIKPSAYIVEGFSDLMPTNFGRSLNSEQLEAVITYLLTLESG